MTKNAKKLLLVSIVLTFFIIPQANAQTIYVNSSTGNDATGDGSSGNPYATFTKGYSMVSTGGTIDLSGTFTWTDADETGDIFNFGYKIQKNITIQGQGSDQTIVQAASSANSTDRNIFTISGAYTVIIKDLNIRNGNLPYESAINLEYGGGVLIESGADVTISGCYIHDNYSANHGAGIHVYAATATIIGSTISDNEATYYGGANGGVYSHTSTLIIDKCTISNNLSRAGGGVGVEQGSCQITNSTITGNTATENYGGGVYVRKCTSAIFTNVTITNNHGAIYGAGLVFSDGSTGIVTNCTVTNNDCSTSGGGLELDGSTLTIKNTILANNVPDDFENYSSVAINDNGYNIIESSIAYTWTGIGDITGNQTNLNISATLEDNGTLNGTQTLKLSSGSVAINAGNSSANGSVSVPTSDQRGASRSGITDIGAYEFEGDIPLPITLTSFSASPINGTIDLTWETASETNNAHFVIYRNDEAIASVEGAGTTSETQNYTYIDDTVIPGVEYTYVLADIDYANTLTRYDDKALTVTLGNSIAEADFKLGAAYPNPFNPRTVISMQYAVGSNTVINIYNSQGVLVDQLVNGFVEAGIYDLTWNAANMPSGVYIVKAIAGDMIQTQKIVLLK